ncbi:uncharacterized protein BDW43DRAFT_314998 [Aspergillus alliaceus]|uniref:uncharacterized protein n=1 Tax=Petromyces alliaceus TaxID=209559 RepID=UPI0012A6C693|nr:uncharacterized protein BDW43DRAFT_314998 [Aspergillus alliaceus]KAB8229417.1 hypothetical protein BDW43DRAFT_314998 [Aspergillus alliaceus]
MSFTEHLYMFHHVFLPPKLPEGDDYSPEHEITLLDRTIQALQNFASEESAEQAGILAAVTTMLTRLRHICGIHGDVNEEMLQMALGQLGTEGGLLPIHLHRQNAAVLMTRVGDAIHVESWELSARNEAVVTTVGRLKRLFPGPTLSLDISTFTEPGLQETIAQTLAKLSHQSVPGTMSKVKKAGGKHDEDRDTTDPKMVTEFFMAFLRPMCIGVKERQIQKHTREEVMWHESRYPWRRSSLWLLIRVVLQLALCRLSENSVVPEDLYKQFMIYLMSDILTGSRKVMPVESIYAMSAKIGRRLQKLNLTAEPIWFTSVQRALAIASDTIQSRWCSIQEKSHYHKDLHSLTELSFHDDVYCVLPALDQYLQGIKRRGEQRALPWVDFVPESKLLIYKSKKLPGHLYSVNDRYRTYNLAAFEEWVATSLDGWLENHLASESTCGQLADLIDRYYTAAIEFYASNPEAKSVMFLTILELWIACDKSAAHIHMILHDYDTCIPTQVFQSLLLPFRSQMERLARAEKYLQQRKERCKFSGPGIFRDFGTPSCFSVRYFQSSQEHHRLHTMIEEHASRARAEKLVELMQKHQKYRHLYHLVDSMECTYDEIAIDKEFDIWERRHRASCLRCRHQREADSMQIEVHEWPLPANHLQAKSTVFELKVPQPFAWWRDVTIFFMLDILRVEYLAIVNPIAHYSPQSHSGLSAFYTPADGACRIGLLSQVKPHERTHRRAKKIIAVSEADVCLANGLHLEYFDNCTQSFVSQFKSTHEVANSCMIKLPHSSSPLQRFLFRPADKPNGESPNMVIALQNACAEDMSLAEYKALCNMPCGIKIQWQNILHQLAMPLVVFKKPETAIFVLQIINQAGPPAGDSALRNGHKILKDTKFASAMLHQVNKAIQRIEENWELVQVLNILISLVLRIVSLSTRREIHNQCLLLLSRLRSVAFRWVEVLGTKASSATDDGRRANFTARHVHIALICVGSFDSEGTLLEQMLQDESDASIFIQCSMAIHDKWHAIAADSEPLLTMLYRRWQVLSHRSYIFLASQICLGKTMALGAAIGRTWAAYRPGPGWSGWSMVEGGTDPWLFSKATGSSAEGQGSLIHFNLLTGELLINGLPLARLPRDYEQDESYKTLFGQSLLEVMPSDRPGMSFSCQKEYMGHTVHLGKQQISGSQEGSLCVRAMRDGQEWEFIQPSLLANLFPDTFVEECVHWFNPSGDYVEFRPVKEPWQSSPAYWRLTRNHSRTGWVLQKDSVFMINVRSRTAKLISDILEPIERPRRIQCKFNTLHSILEIDIPRLRLKFDLESGSSSVHSRQYRGMLIDADQSLGTLIGLHNKLILRGKDNHERLALIPEGPVDWKKDADHVKVSIGWRAVTDLHPYAVQPDLGYLSDNGSLQSKLLLCYLHALTSFCVPDPLTQKTGTEQALSILRSAALRSFERLRSENCAVLAHIAQLTPSRTYYPANERVMQKVQWRKELGFLVQHAEFREEVVAIFEHDRRMAMFHPNTATAHPPLPPVGWDLQKRDKIRSSVFRVSTFGAEEYTKDYDRDYCGLDDHRDSAAVSRVLKLCSIVYNQIPCMQQFTASELVSTLWKFISKSNKTWGFGAPLDIGDMKYDAGLLVEPNLFLSLYWCSIHGMVCSEESPLNRFQLMIWLATLGFAEGTSMPVLATLASFHVLPQMARITLPPNNLYELGQGYEFDGSSLKSCIQSVQRTVIPEQNISRNHHETAKQFKQRWDRILKERRTQARDQFIDELETQWPVLSPTTPTENATPGFREYFQVGKAMVVARSSFKTWFANREFRQYLSNIAAVLSSQPAHYIEAPALNAPECLGPVHFPLSRRGFLTLDDLLGQPPILEIKGPECPRLLRTSPGDVKQTPCLEQFVMDLVSQAKSQFEKNYVEQLRSSIRSLQDTRKPAYTDFDGAQLRRIFLEYVCMCEKHTNDIYAAIESSIVPSPVMHNSRKENPTNSKIQAALFRIRHCPRISPSLVVQQLTRHRWHQLPDGWKSCIITYGCSITRLQWAKRMVALSMSPDDLIRELQNPGHTNWDPQEFPESLLLEIESGILIRDVQEQIAGQMRNCSLGRNVVMQLNMGEGKSSVILPMVAATRANGASLVRILVAKPQSRQMLQMLLSKFGGLLDRRVYLMPISRSLQIQASEADELGNMCRECMVKGGVLLLQPEHLLSLRLMCIESFIAGKKDIGNALLKVLRLLKQYSCDIVDESDENFSVKFELVYTMGAQRPLELSPQRWIVIQQLLGLVRLYASEVKEVFPQSIQVDEQASGGFPRIRLLHSDAGEELLNRIGRHICDNGIGSLPVWRLSQTRRNAVMSYLLEANPSATAISTVEGNGTAGPWAATVKDGLLLLRGLLAQGVLSFCLGQKRWRVNYGPDSTRYPPTNLSVPYRAKDSPAPRSEFSHPDVVIILTQLTYYYSGLSDDEIFVAFNHLLKSDQADTEYQIWIDDAPTLSTSYYHLTGINLEDRHHCLNYIFPPLRFSKGVIDYFLSYIVFPKELKEFADKLSASGWDIGEVKSYPTVGFSGTNDSRKTLPLCVEQLDLPEQNHTNALVLEYLLRPENTVVLLPTQIKGSALGSKGLLAMVKRSDPPIQVILDVGAQILELSNIQVAQGWLEMIEDDGPVQAVVFVDENDEVSVVDRHGRIELLQTSPFAKQLETCLVFLDEAHTRGIDLKLPQNYRAAVTLGAAITKDKLVQACMRLRKLGRGQSVAFYIPEEIKVQILSLTGKENECNIEVSDVLRWAISETWLALRRSIPLWAVQGERYIKQRKLWHKIGLDERKTMSASEAQGFLEPESQTLERRYRPQNRCHEFSRSGVVHDEHLSLIRARCQEFGQLDHASTQLQEEQERELAPEIEQERQVQRPHPAKPEDHYVHPDLISFVSTGVLKQPSDAFNFAFETLSNTTAAKYLDVSQFPAGLLVTTDFARTIKVPSGSRFVSDSYQRPVQWILTRCSGPLSRDAVVKNMVIISPFEANQIQGMSNMSKSVRMHLYAPRQNCGYPSLDELTLYNVPETSYSFRIPETLKIQLNLFAGQLYIGSYSEYREMCDFLGVSSLETPEIVNVAADGFITTEGQHRTRTTFRQSPLSFLNVLMSQIRNDCQEIDKTHVGKLLCGQLLRPWDFSSTSSRTCNNNNSNNISGDIDEKDA